MVKRFAQLSLAVFLVLALATVASAGFNVPNTTQKGTMLVFPLVQLNTLASLDTYFFIGNDDKKEVPVKCYWMDENQSVKDFMFTLTANQPVVFAAGYNPAGNAFNDNAKGSLVCFASTVEDSGPVIHNHLYGYAALVYGEDAQAVYYNAYSFRVNGGGANMITFPIDGGGAQLNLSGDTGFDLCHKYLVTNFVPFSGDIETGVAPWNTYAPDLTLWPCKQDLRQDRVPTFTKAKFDIWRWNETKLTGSYQCFKCFFEGFLHAIGDPENATYYGDYIYKSKMAADQKQYRGPGANGTNFLASVIGFADDNLPPIARMRITGVKSDPVCGVSTVATGLLGVLVYGNPLGTAPFVYAEAAHTLHGAGWTTTPGWVKIDVDDGTVPEAPAQ